MNEGMRDIKEIRKAYHVLANKSKCLFLKSRFADKESHCIANECKNCQMYSSKEDLSEAIDVACDVLLEKIDKEYEEREKGGNG